jgi:multimeric flavodoxin WrbA
MHLTDKPSAMIVFLLSTDQSVDARNSGECVQGGLEERSMAQKIIGLSCGRRNSNCEHFLKAALMAAEEQGFESEIIRLQDFKLKACDSCQACLKTGKCVKDEADWVLEKTMLADGGIIVAAPVYHIRSSSNLIILSEKMNHMFPRKKDLFERRRPSAAISVGGSGYDGWTSLGLTCINLYLQHFTTLVDQVQIDHCCDIGAALTPDNEWAIERSKQMGRNVAAALTLPWEQVKYVGEDTAVSCPVCHGNIIYVEKGFPQIACPVCQVHGTVSVSDGRYSIAWNPEDIQEPRFSTPKEAHHIEWIMAHFREEAEQLAMPDVQEKIKAYNAWGNIIGPERTAKN